MSTPSKKLNEFLRSKAVGAAARDAAAQAEIPEDRDLSPETRAALDQSLAVLKSAPKR